MRPAHLESGDGVVATEVPGRCACQWTMVARPLPIVLAECAPLLGIDTTGSIPCQLVACEKRLAWTRRLPGARESGGRQLGVSLLSCEVSHTGTVARAHGRRARACARCGEGRDCLARKTPRCLLRRLRRQLCVACGSVCFWPGIAVLKPRFGELSSSRFATARCRRSSFALVVGASTVETGSPSSPRSAPPSRGRRLRRLGGRTHLVAALVKFLACIVARRFAVAFLSRFSLTFRFRPPFSAAHCAVVSITATPCAAAARRRRPRHGSARMRAARPCAATGAGARAHAACARAQRGRARGAAHVHHREGIFAIARARRARPTDGRASRSRAARLRRTQARARTPLGRAASRALRFLPHPSSSLGPAAGQAAGVVILQSHPRRHGAEVTPPPLS